MGLSYIYPGVDVNVPISSISIFPLFFMIIKTPVTCRISRSYLTVVTATQRRWHHIWMWFKGLDHRMKSIILTEKITNGALEVSPLKINCHWQCSGPFCLSLLSAIEHILTHWPWEIWNKFEKSNFEADYNDWWLRHLLQNCPQMNVNGPYWW